MAELSNQACDQLCDRLVPHLQHDFQLWSGNDRLLFNCFENAGNSSDSDPMRVIMDCMRAKLQMINDVIITV